MQNPKTKTPGEITKIPSQLSTHYHSSSRDSQASGVLILRSGPGIFGGLDGLEKSKANGFRSVAKKHEVKVNVLNKNPGIFMNHQHFFLKMGRFSIPTVSPLFPGMLGWQLAELNV